MIPEGYNEQQTEFYFLSFKSLLENRKLNLMLKKSMVTLSGVGWRAVVLYTKRSRV